MSIRVAGLLALLAPALSLAGYHNLIATTDGGSVYFAFSTAPAQNNSFVAQKGVDGVVTLIDSGQNVVDINGSGSIVARSQYATLVRVGQCVSGLSGCFDAAPCIAYFELAGAHSEFSAIERPTFVRLNESGSSFFVRQADACVQSGSNPDLVPLLPTGIHPLSDPHSNLALADVVLATGRIGRRTMTNSDRDWSSMARNCSGSMQRGAPICYSSRALLKR